MSQQIKMECESRQNEREIIFDGAQEKLLGECRKIVEDAPANMQLMNAIELIRKDFDFPKRSKL